MSQVLAPIIDKSKILLFQELYFAKKRAPVKSTVEVAMCTICGKGLEDGTSVTAKNVGQVMKFFCQYHLPKDF